MKTSVWNKRTGQAYAGTIIYVIFSLLAPFFAALANISFGFVFFIVAFFLVSMNICALVGYIMFFLGVKGLKENSEGEADGPAFKKIFIAAILMLCAAVLGLYSAPYMVSFMVKSLTIAAAVLVLIACISLRKSPTIAAFSPAAATGFNKLFIAQIISMVAMQIGLIPMFGGIVGGLINIAALVLLFLGWKEVATPVVEAGSESEAPKPIVQGIREAVVLSLEDTINTIKK